jgi:hypothetical protein
MQRDRILIKRAAAKHAKDNRRAAAFALRLYFLVPMFLSVRKPGGAGARSMKSMESRKWGQKD